MSPRLADPIPSLRAPPTKAARRRIAQRKIERRLQREAKLREPLAEMFDSLGQELSDG